MNKDPYRYFRVEARELIEKLGSGVLELEREGATGETVARLLRLAHTLKGAARVVRQGEIAESAHAVEDVLQPYRQGSARMDKPGVAELLRLLDAMRGALSAVDASRDGSPAPAKAAAPGALAPPADATGVTPSPSNPAVSATADGIDSVRVEIEHLDGLLARSAEAMARVGNLRREIEELDQLGHRRVRASDDALRRGSRQLLISLFDGLEALERQVGAIRESAEQIRLVPASTLLPAFERATRDAAHASGHSARLSSSGGEQRLDAHVLATVRDALLHVVRNAVAHGIETPAERAAAGKPAEGQVSLRIERRGRRVAFMCADDGRGLDLEGIRRAAIRVGILTEARAAALLPDELTELLLRGGLSTAVALTQVSGRGVGLDVLRDTALQLNGKLSVRSRPGQGTEFELVVPISLSSVPSLLVDAGGAVVAIPLDAVRRTLRVESADVARSSGRETVVFDGAGIPFLPLSLALGQPAPVARTRPWSAIVVQGGTGAVALGVERLLGTADLVVRPLPGLVDAEAVAGAVALDGEGNPRLVLDPDGLARAANLSGGSISAAQPSARRPVLIIDDSLTTRMLEQSILEAAGYAVDLAASGEEALAKARKQAYSLFVVDVEMPGMNGFEFVERTRADAELRDTPALLVTSLGDEANRRRGLQAGASGYIAKGEFDQVQLLELIGRLIG